MGGAVGENLIAPNGHVASVIRGALCDRNINEQVAPFGDTVGCSSWSQQEPSKVGLFRPPRPLPSAPFCSKRARMSGCACGCACVRLRVLPPGLQAICIFVLTNWLTVSLSQTHIFQTGWVVQKCGRRWIFRLSGVSLSLSLSLSLSFRAHRGVELANDPELKRTYSQT